MYVERLKQIINQQEAIASEFMMEAIESGSDEVEAIWHKQMEVIEYMQGMYDQHERRKRDANEGNSEMPDV